MSLLRLMKLVGQRRCQACLRISWRPRAPLPAARPRQLIYLGTPVRALWPQGQSWTSLILCWDGNLSRRQYRKKILVDRMSPSPLQAETDSVLQILQTSPGRHHRRPFPYHLRQQTHWALSRPMAPLLQCPTRNGTACGNAPSHQTSIQRLSSYLS